MRVLFFLIFITNAYSQNIFKGVVINENGDIISGANITTDLSKEVIFSDKNGVFYIKTDRENFKITISHVGYSSLSFYIENIYYKEFVLESGILLKDEVKVFSTRAAEKSPFVFTNFSKRDLDIKNESQDIPRIIQSAPSSYYTSDAGNGIGYSGIRIRGSDATRINVTINGVPYNDSESHGVFWVNMPDLVSSSSSIQVQRGVGSSTNGGGAFGGTINIKTGHLSENFYVDVYNSLGSYSTLRNSININSGLINQKFNFNLRLSNISSDGYVDRAYSKLKSYYFSTSYYNKKSTVDFINFSGKEKTYQSWWGTPEARINNDQGGMEKVIWNNGYNEEQSLNLLSSGRTFNYYLYENETDNYNQDHYQLHWNLDLNNKSFLHLTSHYTFGKGYYEQYRYNDNLINYFENAVDQTQDIVRRRWLRNHFYGITFSYFQKREKSEINIGGAINEYVGDHYGKIISTNIPNTLLYNPTYYFSRGEKREANLYIKLNEEISKNIKFFADVQVRGYDHNSDGTDNDKSDVFINSSNLFFNPKIGVTKEVNDKLNYYLSFAIANREPIRSDFIDSKETPEHEKLFDIEFGKNYSYKTGMLNTNFFFMKYKNQLITTGEVNDVGAYIRTNVERSRRVGIELINQLRFGLFSLESNLSISKNVVFDFNEVMYNYGEDFSKYEQIINRYKKTNISFSPNIIANNQLEFKAHKHISLFFNSKFVGRQYLDNTSNQERIINSFLVNDMSIHYSFTNKLLKIFSLVISVNNLFNEMYSSNGYTFGYFIGKNNEVRENYFYPQAGRNYMTTLKIRF